MVPRQISNEILTSSYTPFISTPHIPNLHYTGFPGATKVVGQPAAKTCRKNDLRCLLRYINYRQP